MEMCLPAIKLWTCIQQLIAHQIVGPKFVCSCQVLLCYTHHPAAHVTQVRWGFDSLPITNSVTMTTLA